MKLYQWGYLGLLLASRQGVAQTGVVLPEWPQRQWEAGMQVAAYPKIAFTSLAHGQGGAGYGRPWPFMLTLRYHSPLRVAFEAGLLLRLDPAHTVSETTATGTFSSRFAASTWAVPLLVRVQLAPSQPKRWQVDAELGLMPVSSKYTETNSFTAAGAASSAPTGVASQSYNDVPLLVGLGGSYCLTEHIGLMADARLTWSYLGTVLGGALTRRTDYVAPLIPALSAGVSYRFGASR